MTVLWTVISTVLSIPVEIIGQSVATAGPGFHFSTLKLILPNERAFLYYSDTFDSIFSTTVPKIIIVHPALQDVPAVLDTQSKLTNTENLKIPNLSANRFTIQFDECLAFLPSSEGTNHSTENEIMLNSNYKAFQLRSLISYPFNRNPQLTQYIFIGTVAQIKSVFTQRSVQLLRYKIGVTSGSENSGKLLHDRLHSSRNSIFSETGTAAELDSSCRDKLAILRNKHLKAESYATKLHVLKGTDGRLLGGLGYEYFKTIAEYYNSTFEYIVDGYQNVGQMPNGSWHGLIGDLMNSHVDFVFWFGPTLSRYPYIDITTTALTNLDIGMITPMPRVRVSWKAVFYPFSVTVWAAVCVSTLLAVPVVYFLFKNQSDPLLTRGSSLMEVLAFVYGTLLQLSPAKVPKNGRYFVALYLIFAVTVSMFYNSKLASSIILPISDPVPNSIDDLAIMTSFNVNFIHYKGSSSEFFFKNSFDPSVQAVQARMTYVSPKNMVQALIRSAIDGNAVVINYSLISLMDAAENLTIQNSLPVVKTGSPILSMLTYPALRKYSKYTETFSYNIGKLENTGHTQLWLRNIVDLLQRRGRAWCKEASQRNGDENTCGKLRKLADELLPHENRPFGTHHFTFCFASWVFGNIISILALLMERRTPKTLPNPIVTRNTEESSTPRPMANTTYTSDTETTEM